MYFVIVFNMCLLLFWIGSYWLADTYYAVGQNETDIASLEKAVALHVNEPLYHSELGYTAAAAASSVSESDATYSADLKNLAVLETQYVLTTHPSNVSLWRTAIRTYYQLSTLDPNYEQKTVDLFDQTIKLAPTDPKLYYNKGLLLQIMDKDAEAITSLEKAVALKPNYSDAFYSLAELYQKNGQYEKSKADYQAILGLLPGEQKAADKIKELDASISAQTK
jgi:tetratricopeptide (TPR) repeat protein